MPTLKVNGMHCGHCASSVEKAVKAIPGVKSASVDLDAKKLQYEEDTPIPAEVVMKVIHELGFEPEKL